MAYPPMALNGRVKSKVNHCSEVNQKVKFDFQLSFTTTIFNTKTK